jgi:hypothetical protein
MNYSAFNTLPNVKNSVDNINQFLTPLNNTRDCDSDTRFKESQRQGNYFLSERTMTNPGCYMPYQNVSGKGLPVSNDIIVDLDSELRGITHLNSKCDLQKLKKKSIFNKNSNLKMTSTCIDYLTPTDIRTQKSCQPQNERKNFRFDFPLEDQTVIQPNSYIGVNTRLLVKQNLEKEELKYKK